MRYPARSKKQSPYHRARLLTLAVCLLAAGPVAAAADWFVEEDGELRPLPSRKLDGVEYLAAADLAGALGGELREDRGSGNFIMEVAGSRIVLSGREGLVSVDGRIIALKHPNRLEEDGLWVGADFVTKAVAPLYPRAIMRTGRTFVVGSLPPVDVVLRTSHDAAGTRAVLEFSHAVPVSHQSGPRGMRVRVRDIPLEVRDLPRPVEGGVIRAVWYEEADSGIGGEFRFEPGPAFAGTPRVSQLADPFRVVIDFDRAEDARIPDDGWGELPPRDEPRARGIRTVILDPGHGGSEVGAQGPTGLSEKEVVLDVARRVARMLRRRLGVAVVLTRESDQVIPLDERAGIANNHDGDLFVSIHANASRGRRASGAETYYLDDRASDADSERVAMAENRASGAPARAPAGDDLQMTLWDMAQAEHRVESSKLAETIQKELNHLLGTRDRGVRQAPFLVLRGLMMPAVLVEVAFISNPQEEAELRTTEFRERIAEAIAISIEEYKATYESRIGLTPRSTEALGRGGS